MGLEDMIRRKPAPAIESFDPPPVPTTGPGAATPDPPPDEHKRVLAQHIANLATPAAPIATPTLAPGTPPASAGDTPNPAGVTTPHPHVISFDGAYEAGMPKQIYSEKDWLSLLERSKKATSFMLDNAMSPKGNARMDDFIGVIESLYGMSVAYRAAGILNAD